MQNESMVTGSSGLGELMKRIMRKLSGMKMFCYMFGWTLQGYKWSKPTN